MFLMYKAHLLSSVTCSLIFYFVRFQLLCVVTWIFSQLLPRSLMSLSPRWSTRRSTLSLCSQSCWIKCKVRPFVWPGQRQATHSLLIVVGSFSRGKLVSSCLLLSALLLQVTIQTNVASGCNCIVCVVYQLCICNEYHYP